jgi:hypothetical protein
MISKTKSSQARFVFQYCLSASHAYRLLADFQAQPWPNGKTFEEYKTFVSTHLFEDSHYSRSLVEAQQYVKTGLWYGRSFCVPIQILDKDSQETFPLTDPISQ